MRLARRLCYLMVLLGCGGGDGGQSGITGPPSAALPRIVLSTRTQLYSIAGDGTDLKPITANPTQGNKYLPRWSPDRARIVFTVEDRSVVASPFTGVYIVNADGTNLRQLVHTSGGGCAAWSPDGSRLLCTIEPLPGSGETVGTYVVSAADGSRLAVIPLLGRARGWTPDAAHIYGDYGPLSGYFFIANADGSGVRSIPNIVPEDGEPALSPDGARIAFVSRRNGPSEIWTMNLDGTGLTRLTTALGLTDLSPRWSPDGARIVFTRGYGGILPLFYDQFSMKTDGSDLKQLTVLGTAIQSDW